MPDKEALDVFAGRPLRTAGGARLFWGLLLVLVLALSPVAARAQTSWKGTASSAWDNAANWTAGVPNAGTDAIVGDANFTGPNPPSITRNSTCRSLTVGGAVLSMLSVSRNLTVSGDLFIGPNGTISHTRGTISVRGNWTNAGSYSFSQKQATVTFAGGAQTLSGTTAFQKLTINAGSTTKLSANISVAGTLSVSGTVDPGDLPACAISGAGGLVVNSGGTLLVKASTFSGNYATTGSRTLSAGSTVDYAASASQTVDNTLTYSTLRISGGGVKTLGGNLPALGSASPADGNLTVAAGTLDLSSFTASRSSTTAGGTLTVANGAALRVGGANSFPANYATHSLGGSSTVEYSGSNQSVSAEAYGFLVLSSSGASTKTMPSSAIAIAGSLVSKTNAGGASVFFTAGGTLTVAGDVSIGAGTTFNGASYAHSFGGNWTNNGTFNGGTGQATLSGSGAAMSGAGANNFNDLIVSGAGVAADPEAGLNLSGNLSTSGAGTFTHRPGGSGTVAFSGTGKSISGPGITLNHVTVSGTVTTASSLEIAGNLTVSGAFSAAVGTITLSGKGASLSGPGSIAFSALNVPGSITAANSFSVASDLSVSGSLGASAGTATFNGSSTLSGTVNLFHVTLNGTRLQLGTGAVLGVGGALTVTAGAFDVTTTTPNTIAFNASGGQTIPAASYDNLTLSGSGTKVAEGALSVNRDLTVGAGVTFGAGGFSHSIAGNWLNSGGLSAGTSTFQLTGALSSWVCGPTNFNVLAVNKSNPAAVVALSNSVTAATVNMTSGQLNTGTNTLTITSDRTGNGVILGTITRAHAFSSGVAYAFESPNNTISFDSLGSVSSVTVAVAVGPVGDFPFGGAINRQYTVSLTGSGAYSATFRLHYSDSELNGSSASAIQLWRWVGGGWAVSGKSANDTSNGWVEQGAVTDLTGRWTLSDDSNIALWSGAASGAWEDPSNWTVVQGRPSLPPSTNDIVQIGAASFANQPTITSAVQVRSISFGSAQPVTLALGPGGALSTAGNISGSWSNSAAHTLAVGAQSLNVGGDLMLSDGADGHAIALSLSTGTVQVAGSLTEAGGAAVSFSGAGVLEIGRDFNYTSGAFTPGAGTVIYNGSAAQAVAALTYNHLGFNKPSGSATLAAPATVQGNLWLSNNSVVALDVPLAVGGDVALGSGSSLNSGAALLTLGGNWNNSGTFSPGSGTVVLNGGAAQSIAATTFNNLSVSNTTGKVTLAGNVTLNGDLTVGAGASLNLGGYSANRSSAGGSFTVGAGATFKTAGAFPANFEARSLVSSSTVEYNGAGAQTVSGESYGNLIFSGGGSAAKILAGATSVAGDLVINTNATLNAGSATLSLSGNWTNLGAFTASNSAVTLAGAGMNLTGTNSFNTLTVSGSYTVGGPLAASGAATITGALAAGSNACFFAGSFNNAGSFTSAGSTTFAGTGAQTLWLNSGFASTGTVNFNGSVAPAFADITSPSLRHVNVANTGGVAPVVNWSIGGNFSVGSGAAFNGGVGAHSFAGNFTNNGTVTSSGLLTFNPASPVTLSLRGAAFTSTGMVVFGGTGLITFAGGAPSLNSVVVANNAAMGVTPNLGWSLGGDLTVNSGATFNAGTGLTHTLSGNLSVNGTLNGAGSLVVLNGATDISGIGSITFNHLTVAGIATNSTAIALTGNFTNNGVFDATGFDVVFNGSSLARIAGATTPTPIDSLVIAKAAGTVAQAVNLSIGTALTISGGTLDTSTFSVGQAGAGGSLSVAAGATLRLGGSNSFPTFDLVTLDPASTVEYGGSGSQTIAAQNYGNLTSSSTGARTLASTGTIGVAATFIPGGNSYTAAGSTIAFNGAAAQTIPAFNYNNLSSSSTGARTLASSGTIGVAGAFTPGANSYTAAGSTIAFNGGAQTIPAFTYANLTTSGSGTKSLGGNITVSGRLNLAGGSLADGGFVATVNGDVANAVTHTGTGRVLLSGGTTNHILSGGGAFQNLELSDTNGAALSLTNLTVNGTLSLTGGRLATSTNKVIIASSASVIRTNGYVFGWLQKSVPKGAASLTFEIGGATNYAPVSVTFGNVTTAGNLAASTPDGDHPDVANSGIAAARSVNRYWTLTNSGVAFNTYNVTFNFAAADVDPGSDTLSFLVARCTSDLWSQATPGTQTPTNIQATGLSSFGDFEIGQSAARPAVITQPQSQRVNLGSNVTFTITASGGTPLSCQWRFNGVSLPGATNASYSIASAQDANAGFYSVQVTNISGKDLSSNAVLTINHPPSAAALAFTRAPQSGRKVRLATLLASGADPDQDPLSFAAADSASAAGGTVVVTNNWLFYTPLPGVTNPDSFGYALADKLGLQAAGTVSITLWTNLQPSQNILGSEPLGDGAVCVHFLGIPGRTYSIQYTESLALPNWLTLGSGTADTLGAFDFTDVPPAGSPPRFYRSVPFKP